VNNKYRQKRNVKSTQFSYRNGDRDKQWS